MERLIWKLWFLDCAKAWDGVGDGKWVHTWAQKILEARAALATGSFLDKVRWRCWLQQRHVFKLALTHCQNKLWLSVAAIACSFWGPLPGARDQHPNSDCQVCQVDSAIKCNQCGFPMLCSRSWAQKRFTMLQPNESETELAAIGTLVSTLHGGLTRK